MKTRILLLLFGLFALLAAPAQAALDAKLVAQLSAEDSDEKIAAIWALADSEDASEATRVLQSLADGSLKDPKGEDITINNRIRGELAAALASLRLFDADRAARLAAVKELQASADAKLFGVLVKALAQESDAEIKRLLSLVHAQVSLQSEDAKQRLVAVQALAAGNSPHTKSLLLGLLAKNGSAWAEPDAEVRRAATAALKQVESRLGTAENIGRVFSGLSLGSILLLAALGLAITYGVMGVINMAHGEFLMIGAYATFAVQGLFRSYAPGLLDAYVLAAIPVAFLVTALVGMALERLVIRHLYGRPLETLLATWGISLMLIQAARTLFGAQNVEVANPSWMSGGVELFGTMLPWNRIAIVAFSVGVLALMWAVLNLTRLGLFVRAVTQNRPMAGCVGVPTGRVDTLAFGIGAGIAGLGGVALSQIGNVGPDMGQGYIVDSFMVVVLGGVGQLAGAVWAALGLGVVTKFLEGWTGAVIAKIVVLVFIIVFIQKRPQGLFALKGRVVD
ncbi:MAG: urea ABC transporter permease subunit UrtB [Betaproteobacteria bacterium]|nr:urea ABC transporter permease subunit UrtB [Betaproteobacteria bacterium]